MGSFLSPSHTTWGVTPATIPRHMGSLLPPFHATWGHSCHHSMPHGVAHSTPPTEPKLLLWLSKVSGTGQFLPTFPVLTLSEKGNMILIGESFSYSVFLSPHHKETHFEMTHLSFLPSLLSIQTSTLLLNLLENLFIVIE